MWGQHDPVSGKGILRMKRVLVVGGALLLGMGAVWAQQDSVKEVQTLMKGNGKNAGAVAAIVKGEKPYDLSLIHISEPTRPY